MAEVVLDANVIVALLYAADSQHQRAVELAQRLEAEGHNLVLVDFLVFEALSILCRRAAQRKTTPPDSHELELQFANIGHWGFELHGGGLSRTLAR